VGAVISAGPAETSAGRAAAVFLGRQAFCDLERWLASGPCSELGLPVVERETERRGRELLRLQLQAHIDGRGRGDVGPVLEVRGGGPFPVHYTHRRVHTRRLVTLFGTVTVKRTAYSRRGCRSIHPLDVELQLPGRLYSYEVQRRLTKAAVQGPFDEALEVLADSTGIVLSKRSAEQIVRDASVDFECFYAQRCASSDEAEDPILVAAIDSKGIPMVKNEKADRSIRLRKGEKRQKKRMSTVAAVFTQLPAPRTPEAVATSLFLPAELSCTREQRTARPRHKRVWASLLAGKDAFMAGVRKETLRRDPEREKTWVIVTDGERALQRRVCAHFPDVVVILDLLHVLEKLWAAAYTLHAEGSVEAEQFVHERALRILRGQVSQVVKGLRQIVTKRELAGGKRKTLLAVAGYFYRNRRRMRYHEYLELGWPIASGSVEGACKNLIKDRMERSGMRWTPEMAEAMLRLRAIYLSGDFDEYWEFHVLQDQKRLYPQELQAVVEK
jgi:hypothetical protein